jgi:hypothetical protein
VILEDYLTQRCGMTRDEDGNAIFDGRRRSGAEQLSISSGASIRNWASFSSRT